MNRPWVLFLICMAAGIVLTMVLNVRGGEGLSDVPARVPARSEVVPAGTVAKDVVRISDESRIGELMDPTPTVEAAAKKVVDISCSQGTDLCKLQAIYDFVRLNYEFKQTSPEHRHIQSPAETLLYGSGDSLEFALLMSSMQRAVGFNSEILRGPYHSFVRVYDGNTSIIIDPACAGCRFLDVRISLTGRETVIS